AARLANRSDVRKQSTPSRRRFRPDPRERSPDRIATLVAPRGTRPALRGTSRKIRSPKMADPSQESIVEARALRKRYGPTLAVDDVSFKVARGEVVGFLGPNGAGKSTTMKMLTGYLRPSDGAALVGGIPVADDPLGAQRRIGYLPENAPLYDDMMVIDFLHFVGELRGVGAAERR